MPLKECCFAAPGEMMPYGEAMKMLRDRLDVVVGTENVPLMQALGRTLAKDIIAARDVPPHDNSAMDGFAVFYDDLNETGETRLPVTGRIAAGHPLDREAKRGEALRIFTGAPVPPGPDTIFMQEDVCIDGDVAIFPEGIKRGANRRKQGEDVQSGSIVVEAGQLLRPQEIGLAASVGCAEVEVFKKLKVAVFSTGDEVRDPSDEAPKGCIFDANRFTVMNLLEGMGCQVTDLGILADKLDVIRDALDAASKDHDLLFTSGGVSVGDEDHVKPAVEALGSLTFWRLAIKPGRPIALGQVGDAAFVGLPGNPVAAMVTFMRIARILILTLSGRTDVEPRLFKVEAGAPFDKKAGRREWMRASLKRGDDGVLRAYPFRAVGSGILTSMVESDGLMELGEDQGPVEAGDLIDFLPFTEVSQ